jgi:ribonuclease HI
LSISKAVIYTDGMAMPNPGPAAIGAVIKDERDNVIASISQAIGRATNNQAEYRAIIAALEKAVEVGADTVEIRADSELVVRQINGRYRVKNAALKPLYRQVRQLQSRFKGFSVTHIPRRLNREADRLASEAIK